MLFIGLGLILDIIEYCSICCHFVIFFTILNIEQLLAFWDFILKRKRTQSCLMAEATHAVYLMSCQSYHRLTAVMQACMQRFIFEVWKFLDDQMRRGVYEDDSASIQSFLPPQNDRLTNYFPVLMLMREQTLSINVTAVSWISSRCCVMLLLSY